MSRAITALIERINSQFRAKDMAELDADQVSCLYDAARSCEALAMLDDFRARLLIDIPAEEPLLFSAVECTPIWADEGSAADHAAGIADAFAAVAIVPMARGDRMGDEWSVVVYSGPHADLAAARDGARYWVNGEEH